ncbi:hypothetical protein [Clostridium estertheticum]|uniref:hypothetical protein n=1 Tax=Clostridium estertheticum TaxID=238834 RepID=UPI001C0D10DE|nr:hypothetical protein [Clostridium estertheticum]MBU3186520.1 hypothetical protein [Clostridium estertheticum]
MKKYDKEEVTCFKEILVETTCDLCKQEIPTDSYYYEVITGHNDWGHDSVDSIEKFDICSDECLKKKFNEYLEESSKTKYIEIEKSQN